jgi:hypothetical protein
VEERFPTYLANTLTVRLKKINSLQTIYLLNTENTAQIRLSSRLYSGVPGCGFYQRFQYSAVLTHVPTKYEIPQEVVAKAIIKAVMPHEEADVSKRNVERLEAKRGASRGRGHDTNIDNDPDFASIGAPGSVGNIGT